MDKIKVFKVGELVTMASGEYSDYCVNGLFRVIKEFDASEKFVEWAEEEGLIIEDEGVDDDFCDNAVGFVGWLNKNRFIDEVLYRELHTGSYGRIELS